MDKLLKFLNGLSKDSRATFAKACGTSEGYLRKAVSSRQLLHAVTCVAIERESRGAVTRKDLHPDDWEAHWPELASSTSFSDSTPDRVVALGSITGEAA